MKKKLIIKTSQRLDECYKEARTIEFDKSDRFVFFSDVHRGDNSMSDEFAHNQNIYYYALEHYYEEGYHYFELGDGDELWEHSKFKVIMSAHSDVFLLLRRFFRKNRFDTLYGNHNIYLKNKTWVRKNLYMFNDEYLEQQKDLFERITVPESLRLKYKETGQELLLVHGHQGDFFNDTMWPVSMFSLRYFWRFLHVLGFHNPASPSKNRVRRHKIELNFTKWINKKKVGIICGHTHRPKLAKQNQPPYFNCGCCIHPRGINGIEIVEGKIMLIDWRVRPDHDGNLKISKKIIRGPYDLSGYYKLKEKNKKKRGQ